MKVSESIHCTSLIISFLLFQDDDAGDKSDGDLVVDVGNEDDPPRPSMGLNGDHRDSVGSAPDRGRNDRPPSNMSSSSRCQRHKTFFFSVTDAADK